MRKFTLFLLGMFIISNFCASAQIFSDIEYYGDTTNYEEANDTLWSLITYDDDVRYGIDYPKEAGGNRTNIVKEKILDYNFFVTADVKLFKRENFAPEDQAFWEDAVLYCLYLNDTNYVKAEFFNTHGPAESRLSGFTVVINDTSYVLKKADIPADEIEEIPAETCLPYVGDTSFADWNNIAVKRVGSVLSMVVNGEVYYEMDIDTLTVYQSGTTFEAIPQKVIDFLNGSGQVGIGTGNDKIYFDNVNAGYVNVEGIFSDKEGFGDAANYTETNAFLWSIIEDEDGVYYGVDVEKATNGSRRQSIYQEVELDHDFFIDADVKLFPRSESGPTFEDAMIYFNYTDDDNYASAWYFIHPFTEDDANSWDPFGLSGFEIKVDGVDYRLKHFDIPGDEVEEIPDGSAIPYNDDMTSFDAWNTISLVRKGTILSMVVNDEEYWSIDVDTLTVINPKGTSDLVAIPQEVKDLLLGTGKFGVGSGNDKLYFDNIEAGYIPVEGIFSDIEGFGDAGNYTETNAFLWSLIEDGDNVYYGVDVEKATNGSRRQSIYDEVELGNDYFVEADVKLFPRSESGPTFEDAMIYFNYTDDDNYASAWYFIHPFTEDDANSWDPFGLSGFEIKVNGVDYRLKHFDIPGDEVEEIPDGSAIPYNDDMASFDAWNTIRLERNGTILSMIVNDEEYWSVDVDTLTVINPKGTSDLVAIPQEVKDLLLGSGKVGVGSGNDKLYFDNIEAGYMPVEGIFSDIEGYGDAANYTETNAFLWSIIEDGDNVYYGVDVEKATNGSRRQSIYDEVELDNDYFIDADVKLFPRSESGPTFEDAMIYFNYTDDDNYASAWYFIHPFTEDDANSWDPFGLSGFEIKVDGVDYRLKHFDIPGDEVEEIPDGSAIPYNDDMTSFDAWNTISLVRKGTILSMIVNDEEYWSIDVDTLTVINLKGTSDLVAIPQEVKDLLLGSGKFGVGSGNDKLYFDNIEAGALSSDVTVSDIAFKASTIEGFTAGALADQYTVTVAAADTAYITDSLVIVPNDANSVVEILSITSDIQETSGTYTVEFKVVSTSGTEAISSIVFDFTLVGINEFSVFGYKIYPNPVHNVLKIENIEDVSRIEVFGLTGQKLMTVETFGKTSIEVNTSNLKTGVYLVKAYSTQNISIAKILKK